MNTQSLRTFYYKVTVGTKVWYVAAVGYYHHGCTKRVIKAISDGDTNGITEGFHVEPATEEEYNIGPNYDILEEADLNVRDKNLLF